MDKKYYWKVIMNNGISYIIESYISDAVSSIEYDF